MFWKINNIIKVIFTRNPPKISEAWTFVCHSSHKQAFGGTGGVSREYTWEWVWSPQPTCAVGHSLDSEDATSGPSTMWLMSPMLVRLEEGAWERVKQRGLAGVLQPWATPAPLQGPLRPRGFKRPSFKQPVTMPMRTQNRTARPPAFGFRPENHTSNPGFQPDPWKHWYILFQVKNVLHIWRRASPCLWHPSVADGSFMESL